ncbi:2,3-bisphosphoglycerate-independent phosphoglycerate mutase [Candidatus Parcubacteria bacterium]|nr:MAG: 2,3-bisphosphoglycerate-independent phosphoglycerate mutase [Candidatus Parcubacteria bacterium]
MVKVNKKRLPLVLMILDGWGLSQKKEGNAIALAKTPNMDFFYKNYAHTEIEASSVHVGLPLGQPGNSEAGHMNIGAGRVVEQDSVIISRSINNGTFFKNPAFLQAANHVNKYKSDIHLIGMLSDGSSPHTDMDHLLSLLTFFISKTDQNIYLHLFTDGRDGPKFAALKILTQFKEVFNSKRVKVATIMGRFYAMDRKKSWDRTRMAYEAMVLGKGHIVKTGVEAVSQAYNRGESDEYITPTVISQNHRPIGPIGDKDAIIFWNLRSDRARQLTKCFVQEDFEKKNLNSFKRAKMLKDTLFVALTDFGPDLGNVLTAYPSIDISDTLPLALHDLRQLYIAETEKYAHVTYFFNGGYDHNLAKEEWHIIPSKDVASYDKVPQMSNYEISDYVISSLENDKYDFMAINFSSPDMIGHTGNLQAAIKTVEIVDELLGKISEAVLKRGGTLIVTADHGNVEEMLNTETGEVITEHTTNPVPFILINHFKRKLKNNGKLANIAPTILDILGIEQPKMMTADSLIIKNK